MNRMDFSSVASIIRKYTNEINKADQLDFLYRLFDAFVNDEKEGRYGGFCIEASGIYDEEAFYKARFKGSKSDRGW